MKFFLVRICIMFILLTTGIAIIILIPLPDNSYDLAIIDKCRILADTESPKIVLAGGSNLAFGIDSAAIQDVLHIPVVNMGLHGGIGLGRILDDISPFLNSGDILLIAPEYNHFTTFWNGYDTAYELIFTAKQYRLLWSPFYGLPKGFSLYILTHMKLGFSRLLDIIRKTTNTSNLLAYSRYGFNEYGDYIKHLNMENVPFDQVSFGKLNKTYLKRFFKFVDNFTRRGITVALSYPSFDEQLFYDSTTLIQELDTAFRMKENLLVISSPADYFFPHDYFFDTVGHLNKEGRSVRTRQLIQDLQASGLFNIQSP